MRKSIAVCLITAFAAVAASNAWALNITYIIVNYPNSQGGDTVTGTITTDGTIGPLVTANILSASFTIVDPSGVYIAAAAAFEVGAQGAEADTYRLTATPTELYLPFVAAADDTEFEFFGMAVPNVEEPHLALSYYQQSSEHEAIYQGYGLPVGQDFTEFWGDVNLDQTPGPSSPGSTIGNGPMLIATVPEPATLTLFGSALLLLGGFRWRQWRKGSGVAT